jgi:outer membrane murein-binding lipoprotein Lpp
MKKRIFSLLIASVVLGLVLTGCSGTDEKKESVQATTNTEITDLDESVEETEEASATTTATASADDQVLTGTCEELGKYKVGQITSESTNAGVYELKFTSTEDMDNMVKYFDKLLTGTSNYVFKEIPTIGTYIKGTLNDKGISVTVNYGEGNNGTLVEFFTYS